MTWEYIQLAQGEDKAGYPLIGCEGEPSVATCRFTFFPKDSFALIVMPQRNQGRVLGNKQNIENEAPRSM